VRWIMTPALQTSHSGRYLRNVSFSGIRSENYCRALARSSHGLVRGDYGSRLRKSGLLRAMEKEQNQNGQNNGDCDSAVHSFAATAR
jgi:hypothetical protein